MNDDQLDDFIREICDPRSWRVAAAMVALAKRAQESDCVCDMCVELRALDGAIDDIHGEKKNEG